MTGQPLSLQVALEGKDLLSPLLQKAQQSVDQFGKQITAAGGTLQQTAGHAATTGKAVQAAGQQMEQAATSAGGAFTKLSQSAAGGLGIPLSIAAATAAVVAFGTSSVTHFAELDKQLRGVNSLFGLTGEASQKSFEGMSNDVRQFAVRMGVDAVGAAKSLYDIVSSGVTEPAAAMKVLEVATRAAIGGMTDAQTAGNGLTSVLNAYHLSADQATKVSDQMFQTVNLGKVTFGELSGEIGKVAPIAAAAGIGFDQVGAAIATMTKQGISAGSASTDLVQIINQFNKPTVEAANVAKLLGIQFDANSLKGRDLVTVLNEVVKATNGDKEALALLFGSVEAVNGVLALTGQQAQGAASDLESIRGSAGAADKAFQELNQSTARQFEAMGAKVGFFKDNLARDLLPVIGNVIDFVDQIGQKLGAWPADVPPKDQSDRMTALADAAGKVATEVTLAGDAYTYLDDHIKSSRAVQASPESIGGAFGQAARDAIQATIKSTDDYQKKQVELSAAVRAGTITQAEATKQLAAFAQSQVVASLAQRDFRSEQTKLDEALQGGGLTIEKYTEATAALKKEQEDQAKNEAQGNMGKVDSLGVVQQQIDAAIKQASTERQAAADRAASTAQGKQDEATRAQSIRDRIKAQQEADAAAESARKKALADIAAFNAKRAQQDADLVTLEKKTEREIGDAVNDGETRIQDIKDRHDTAYNQAIIDATTEQAAITKRAGDEQEQIARVAGEHILDDQNRLNDLLNNSDEAAADHQVQANRRQFDQELSDRQRAADRTLALDRQTEDRRIAQQEREADRALEVARAAQDKQDAITGAKTSRGELDTSVVDAKAEREKQKNEDVAAAKHKLEEDTADADQTYRDRLADATTADARAKADREHAQAIARIKRQYDDDAAKRDDKYADEEAKADKQYQKDIKRQDDQLKKQLDDLDKREAERAASEERSAVREEAHRKLADDRRRQDERESDNRAVAQRNTQNARDTQDWNTSRSRAEQALRDDIRKTEEKRDKDITASQQKAIADINLSNDLLLKKQGQIDAAREKDFAKFVEDVGKRLRDMEQQYGDSVGRLDAATPAKVAAMLGLIGGQFAGAAARLKGDATSGFLPDGSYVNPLLSDKIMGPPVGAPKYDINGVQISGPYNGEAGQSWWSTPEPDNGPTPSGDTFTPTPEQQALTDSWAGQGAGDPAMAAAVGQALTEYRQSLTKINKQFESAIIGGDAREASGIKPPAVSLPPANSSAEASLAWMKARLGSQEYNGFCERFVENSFGTGGRYASAWTAAQAMMTVPGGTLEGAPRGSIVFFRPDPSNGGFGHVGEALGGGPFRSATNQGVTDTPPSRYWSGLYAGYGAPRFADGGVVRGAPGSPQTVVAHADETILNPKERQVVREFLGTAGAPVPAPVVPAPPAPAARQTPPVTQTQAQVLPVPVVPHAPMATQVPDILIERVESAPIDYDRMAQAMARAVASELRGLRLAVGIDDVHTAFLRKQQRNGSLGLNN